MAGRFTNLHARFYDVDLAVIDDVPEVEDVGFISAVTEAYTNGAGETTVVFPAGGLFVGTLTAKPYLICCIFYTDDHRGDVDYIPFCEPFKVKTIVNGPEANQVTISGMSLIEELTLQTVSKPIGAAVVTNTTIHNDNDGPAPVARTLARDGEAGDDLIELDSRVGGHVGDEIRIQLDNGNWHVSGVTAREPQGMLNVFQMADKLPSLASEGNDAEFRTRWLRVATTADAAAFQVGVECRVTLDSAAIHTTVITQEPTGTDRQTIRMRDGLPSYASANNAVQATAYTGKSTTDVTQILAVFNTWTANFQTGTGTEDGTRYAGGGDTVYDILRSIADETGEHFRKTPASSTRTIARTITWRRTPGEAGTGGGTLRMVQPAQNAVVADALNDDRAILVDKPVRTREYDLLTQVIPVAGDARVTLFACSDAAVAEVESDGFTVFTTGLGLYAPPYVQYDAAEAVLGALQRRVTFTEITVESDNVDSIREAADKMLRLTVKYLRDHSEPFNTWDTARFVSPVDILPGQSITMVYDAPDYTGSWSSSDLLYIQSVRREITGDGEWAGVPLTSLTVSDVSTADHAAGKGMYGRTVAKEIKAVARIAARSGTPKSVSISVSAPTNTGPPPDPEAVTDNSILDPLTILTTNSTGRLTLAELVVGEEDGNTGVKQETHPLTVRAPAQFRDELDAQAGVTLTNPDNKTRAVLQRLTIGGQTRLVGRAWDAVFDE
jgi:hypothetical protein